MLILSPFFRLISVLREHKMRLISKLFTLLPIMNASATFNAYLRLSDTLIVHLSCLFRFVLCNVIAVFAKGVLVLHHIFLCFFNVSLSNELFQIFVGTLYVSIFRYQIDVFFSIKIFLIKTNIHSIILRLAGGHSGYNINAPAILDISHILLAQGVCENFSGEAYFCWETSDLTSHVEACCVSGIATNDGHH